MKRILPILAFATAAAAATAQSAGANVAVQGAWARAVLQGQASSGAYMTLIAREPLQLTGASSPAAGIIEIHQMKLEGDVMKMRAVDTLDLGLGKAVEFKPGGYHFMLMDLKLPFRADTRIPLTLQFKDAQGKARTLQISLPVGHAPPTPRR